MTALIVLLEKNDVEGDPQMGRNSSPYLPINPQGGLLNVLQKHHTSNFLLTFDLHFIIFSEMLRDMKNWFENTTDRSK